MDSKKQVYALHSEHAEWINKLSFYKDEIAIMRSRLAGVGANNTASDVQVMVEHFENLFIIQSEALDILTHAVKEEEKRITDSAKDNPVAVDHRSMSDNTDLRDQMATFEKLFAELRKEMTGFTAKWL